MRLVTIDDGRRGVSGALLRNGDVVDLRRAALPDTVETWIPSDLRALLEAGAEGMDIARRVVDRIEALDDERRKVLFDQRALLPSATPLLAPLAEPRLILAAGLAYRSHLAEMAGTPVPKHPTAFMKSPTSITGPGAAIRVPADAAAHVDYEGELAVVFGRDCHGVSEADAMDYVAGYTVANDVSARDWVREVWQASEPWEARLTWEVNIMGKQFPGFTALGPALLTRDEVPDVRQLCLTTRLNGITMQSSTVADLIFELPAVIAWFSRWYGFTAGDVLLTGTPAGVGVGRKPPVFMHPGDTIEVHIDGIGTLRNTISD